VIAAHPIIGQGQHTPTVPGHQGAQRFDQRHTGRRSGATLCVEIRIGPITLLIAPAESSLLP
jgi:hypothetical protein